MSVTLLQEEQYTDLFLSSYKKYYSICEGLFTKAIDKANNRMFARKFFLHQIESQLEFHKGFKFNGAVLDFFQLSYNLGFSWNKFLKEVRILQKIHTYHEDIADMTGYAMLHAAFSPQEVKRISIEAQILQSEKSEKCIYNYMRSDLLAKSRDIDFINYVAKYKSVSDFIQTIRTSKAFNEETDKKAKSRDNDGILWSCAKGKKIDLIRLLVALNDCKYFETQDGLVPNQEQLMTYFGEMLGINLKHYEQDLSNGFESKLQTNIAIFEKLKFAVEKRFHQKVEQN